MPDNVFTLLALDLIEPSLTNPRKTFHAGKLQELADSIKASGLHQPVLVRPLPATRVADTSTDPATGQARTVRPTHELVCGERRYRASRLAGASTIPAFVRELTDEQVLEIQIIENLQRDDLSELEEADGYGALMRHSGLTADQVGEKIGKSRSYVYARLKLLDLCGECQQALRDGQIDASRALLIARIPDGKLQLKALAYATEATYHGSPRSVRELQDWLKVNVMLKLEHAIFKITDARLVESAGSCADCPKRTGANPDLFADVDGADICTDPACYHAKEEAHRAALVKRAEAKGLRIVQDKEALELLDGKKWMPTPSGYTDLHAKRPDLTPEGDRPLTLAQALGADAPAPILFIHPRDQVARELVPEDEARAVLLAKGLIKTVQQSQNVQASLERQLKIAQEAAQQATDNAIHKAIDEAVVSAVHNTTPTQARELLTGEVLRAMLLAELDDYCGEDIMARCARYTFADGEDEMDAITRHLQRMGDTELLRTATLFLMDWAGTVSDSPQNPVSAALAHLLNVDTRAAAKAATARVKAQYAEQIKALKTQLDAHTTPPAAAPSADGPAAHATGGGVGNKVRGKVRAKTPPAAPALTPEAALSGIAAAMQGLEGPASAPEGAVAPATADDGLYTQAETLVREEQKASKRLLKERLGIGQDRALALLDQLEANGVIGPVDATRNRPVLVTA